MRNAAPILRRNSKALFPATDHWRKVALSGNEKAIADSFGEMLFLGYVLGNEGEERFLEALESIVERIPKSDSPPIK